MLQAKRLKELRAILPRELALKDNAELEAIGLKIARLVLLKELMKPEQGEPTGYGL